MREEKKTKRLEGAKNIQNSYKINKIGEDGKLDKVLDMCKDQEDTHEQDIKK